MTIGIIGAMEIEVAKLKESMTIAAAKNIIGLDFYIGKLGSSNVVVVRSGVGKVNAALCTQVLVDMFAVDAVINTGVAGAVSGNVHINDIVVSTDAVQHDFDTTLLGDDPGFISGIDTVNFEADGELCQKAIDAASELGMTVHWGRIASGDQFISSNEQKERIRELFNPLCCEMEGAAIAHACCLNKIPFVILRAISDNANEGNGMAFDEFCAVAADNVSAIVKKLVSEL